MSTGRQPPRGAGRRPTRSTSDESEPAGRRARSRRASASAAERRRSDLWPRVAVAVPAAIIAIIFVDLGGLAWALLMIAIGAV